MRESWGKGYGVSSELECDLTGDGGVHLPCVHKHGSHAARSMHLWISPKQACAVLGEEIEQAKSLRDQGIES
jgi:hypothetical protein